MPLHSPRSDHRTQDHSRLLRFGRSLAATLALGAALGASAQPVTARLEIPVAETHVVGDPITLTWHFTNPTAKPMAFVWEACCRLNGRLIVSQGGVDLPPIPPGPAAAHAFAKPAIILPGRENAFESMLADWVFITRTGRYQLRGRYVGVMPEQKPPYPRSVELWRGEADTPPVAVELVSVPDYLTQRDARSARRGIEAAVTGPDRLPALGAATFHVRVRNTGKEPLPLTWPLDADLWLVDDAGIRVYRSPNKPAGAEQVTVLAPGADQTFPFPVAAADLNGGAFGAYQVFIDFPARPGLARVPAAAHRIRWQLGASETVALLNAAAAGTTTATRNAPLLLVRRYLAALEPVLAGLPDDSLSPAAATLRRQLQVAATLRTLPATAGRVSLRIDVRPGGTWHLAEPSVAGSVSGTPGEQLQALVGARRHLGLELATNVRPTAGVTVGDAVNASTSIAAASADFAAPPRLIADAAPGAVSGSVAFTATPPPANLVLRVTGRADALKVTAARQLPAPGAAASLAAPAAFGALAYAPLADAVALEALLNDGKLPAPQVVIVADSAIRWSALAPWLDAFLRRGWQVDLTVASN
ncbi:hypothetical protein [Horticoccus sp. 23ND18S-11]|uniref:hypothetical protein n=1 Tax=Horticoccus sp. 23ND18S-11 TaxID=3391832 RepID=UPI0039C93360